MIWFSIEDLGALVRRHRVDDSIAKGSTPVLRAQLVIVDDIGLLPLSADAAEGLYRLIDAAYEKRSLAISSNLHPSGFDQLMDRTIATPGRPATPPRPRHSHRRRQRAPRRRPRRQTE